MKMKISELLTALHGLLARRALLREFPVSKSVALCCAYIVSTDLTSRSSYVNEICSETINVTCVRFSELHPPYVKESHADSFSHKFTVFRLCIFQLEEIFPHFFSK